MNVTCGSSSASTEYLVSYGLTGELGRFAGPAGGLARGMRVVIPTSRGVEIGEVLRPASSRLGELMGDPPAGDVIRAATEDDERRAAEQAAKAAAFRDLPGVLDCEVLFDGRTAMIQVVGLSAVPEASALAAASGLTLTVIDLAPPAAESGCGSCGSGGGCGTGCGGETSDVRGYFAALREQRDSRRVSLL